jgi:predicted permease
MRTIIQDVRFGLRMLAKNPGFTAVAVLSLALGIGANTAIFSLVNGILLSSLPVPNPQELRVIQWSGNEPKTSLVSGNMRPVAGGRGKSSGRLRVGTSAGQRVIMDAFTYSQYRALREQCAAQADIFGYKELHDVTVRARGEPFVAAGMIVTGNFFSGLDVRPVLGRLFTLEDDMPGAAPVVAISFGWWEKQFDLDPSVLGRTVTLNGNSYAIVGVLPREFAGVGLKRAENEFYVPMSAQPHLMPGFSQTAPDHWWIKLMARLKPGVKEAQFQAMLDVTFAAQAASTMKEPQVELSSGRAGPAYDREFFRRPLLILLGVVGTVLLVACANLAGLSLARGAARQHELAVRAALGASRRRLIRQSLTESLMLALLGGTLGVVLAVWGKTIVSRLLAGSPEGLRYDLSLDLTVLGFTLVTALVAALLSGLLPALRAGYVDPLGGLKDRAAVGAPRLRTGRTLVTAQVALSVLLVVGAGLFLRTLLNLVRINPGFATENLLLFQLNPGAVGLHDAALTSFYERVQESLAAIPGVRAASLVQLKLLSGVMTGGSFKLPAHPELDGEKPFVYRLTVGETFFATMEIPIRLGRGFTAADADGATKVVVVNETFVRECLSNVYPIGQVLRDAWTSPPNDWQIIGVCRDAKYTGIKTDVPPTVYFSYRQDRIGASCFALRTAVPPLSLVSAVRKAVAAVDPNVPLSDVTTQKAVRDNSISQETMFATLCGALAGLAVLLSWIGLYGLMAYNVARRTGEIGIRMALGATRQNIAGPILREALLFTAFGMAAGVPAALALTRLIKSQLYGVQPNDPLTLIGAGGLLIAVAVLAAWIPARRAAKVDPKVALRYE